MSWEPITVLLKSLKASFRLSKEYGCDAVLVGDEDGIKAELRREHEENNPHVTIHHASEVIEMKDHPGISVKKKRDASIVVATDLLRQKNVMPLFLREVQGQLLLLPCSAWAVSKGIERPAIATVIPSLTGATVLLDSVPRWTQNRSSLSKVPSWDRFMLNPSLVSKIPGRTP